VMHRRVPVIAEGDIAKAELRCHDGLMASRTTAQSPAETASAAASRPGNDIRRIDHGDGWAGCGLAGSWL